MVQVIACAREGPNQQGTALAKFVLYRSNSSIRVVPHSIAAPQFIILAKKTAVDVRTLYLQHQVVGNIGRELNEGLPRSEHFIQSVVRLYRAHVAMIAEVSGQALTDQST